LNDERILSAFAAEVATPRDLPGDLEDELSGTTLMERINYAIGHIVSAQEAFNEIDDLLESAEADSGEVERLLSKTHHMLERANLLLTADAAQWNEIASWADQDLDQVNYHAPVTYLLYAMRQFLRALLCHIRAVDPECTSDHSRQLLTQAKEYSQPPF
jgi:hypothetical protein